MKVPAAAGGGVTVRRRSPARARLLGTGTALFVTALLATACGMPYQRSPQALDVQMPPQLTTPTEVTPSTTPQAGAVANLYYINSDDNLLTQFPTQVAKPETLSEVLATLEAGPTIRLAGLGARSYLPPASLGSFTAGPVVRRVAYIGLVRTYFALTPAEEVFALSQVVYTVVGTFSPQVNAVQFEYNGEDEEVYNGHAQLVRGTVNETTYCLQAGNCKTSPSK
ncbi:MAG: GerMN domain-containing protein [Acidimicrobiales bacterium]|jgi:hypothetical protein